MDVCEKQILLEPGWISDAYELHEPEFYKLVKTVTLDDDSQNIYTVPVVWWNQQASAEESKYEYERKNALIVPGEYISKKEPSKISGNKTMRLYIFPGATTLLYQQGNQNLCILSSLTLALHYLYMWWICIIIYHQE